MSVTIYTRPTCGPCRTVKYFLQKKGILYTEKNVDDPDNMAEFTKFTTAMQLPFTLIGANSVSGANIPLLSKLLMV